MDPQESLIQSISYVEESEPENTTVPVVSPTKSRLLILEPAVLFLFFAWSVTGKSAVNFVNFFFTQNLVHCYPKGTVFQNQIIYQTCTEILKLNKSECALLGTQNATNETEVIEKLVQPYAARFFMAKTIIESLLPALASLFIGPWSDKFGRKPVIVTTFVGEYRLTDVSRVTSNFSIN